MDAFEGISPFIASNGGYFVSRGTGSHPHRIIDSHELIYVTSGVLSIFEEERHFELSKGNSLLLFPGRRHGGLAQYPADLKFFWFHFNPVDGRGDAILEALPQKSMLADSERMSIWFRQILNNAGVTDSYSIRSGLLLALMLLEIAETGKSDEMTVRQTAVKAHEYITVNFASQMSASDIAAKLACNPDYLGRIFKETYNVTMTGYLNYCRINHARKMLLESNANINQIVEASGFNDTAYFRRRFKKHTGVSPYAYRRQYGNVHINTD